MSEMTTVIELISCPTGDKTAAAADTARTPRTEEPSNKVRQWSGKVTQISFWMFRFVSIIRFCSKDMTGNFF